MFLTLDPICILLIFDADIYHLKMSVKAMNEEFSWPVWQEQSAHLYGYPAVEAMEPQKVEFPQEPTARGRKCKRKKRQA